MGRQHALVGVPRASGPGARGHLAPRGQEGIGGCVPQGSEGVEGGRIELGGVNFVSRPLRQGGAAIMEWAFTRTQTRQTTAWPN